MKGARWCSHGFLTSPGSLCSLNCPYCFPEPTGPEWGDRIGSGYCGVIFNGIRERGWIRGRWDAIEDLFMECRLHLLEKRDVLTRVAEQGLAPHFIPLNWDSPAMRAYIARIVKNLLIDRQLRNSEYAVQRGKRSIVTKEGNDIPIPIDSRGRILTPRDDVRRTGRVKTLSERDKQAESYSLALLQSPFANEPNPDGKHTPDEGMLNVPHPERPDIHETLATVEPECRAAFLARYPFLDPNSDAPKPKRKWDEVARLLGCNERTARRRVQAVQEALKEAVTV